jgi:tRNA 5-methylaminomethyl-2-thiouridine biosynthesis bifunctional protein
MPPDSSEAGLDWTREGAPRSRRFHDIYFSREGGLDETRAVYLQGCGLPEAWAGRGRFTVAELGFGTGLNILALLDLWRRHGPAGGRLSIFSVEAYPLSRDEAERALGAWPELADLAQDLIGAWPRGTPGFHRIDWPAIGATLDLAIGEALWAVRSWDGAADAWFLDGFSPAKNPQMWRPELLAAVAAHSAPGARLATFTVAGAVRRGLAEAGFAVDRRPGHGAKRERLEARAPGAPPDPPPVGPVAVIGAGIAGAAMARALAAQGIEAIVLEADAQGAGASGNPAAMVSPGLDAGGGPRARLHAQAFAWAVDLYRALGAEAVIAEGALQLEKTSRDAGRFDAVAGSGLFAPEGLARLAPAEASARLGAPAPGGLFFSEGLSVRPAVVLQAWLKDARRLTARVTRCRPVDPGWAMLGPDGEEIARAAAVVVATGAEAAALLDLPIAPVRGQASWAPGAWVAQAASWGGYVLPMDGGVLFGATHDRGSTDRQVLAQDHERNLAMLAQMLPDLAAKAGPLHGRASLRAMVADTLPVAGALGDGLHAGLFVLGALGSRGFTTAPLLAEHLAAMIAGAPSPLPLDLQAIVDPARLRRP